MVAAVQVEHFQQLHPQIALQVLLNSMEVQVELVGEQI
jgi:hypothetical protein